MTHGVKSILHCCLVCCCITATLILLAACQSDNEQPAPSSGTPITVTAAVQAPTTRAATGQTADMNYKVLTQTGFGLYAYGPYGKTDNYSSSATKLPGTGNNTKVEYIGSETNRDDIPSDVFLYPGNWSYGTTVDWEKDKRYAFLAYAPYVSAGVMDEPGITSVSSTGDPKIGYAIGTTPGDCVDLLWAVNEKTGMPWTDVTLSDTGGPVLLTFHHALAAIGFHVQAMIDKSNDTGNLFDHSDVADLLGTSGKYKITIKKLELTGDFHPSGTFSLNNSTAYEPSWATIADLAEKTLTVGNTFVDTGFKHPDEGDTDATKAENIMKDGTLTGVTQDPQQLLVTKKAYEESDAMEQSFFVIPTATAQNYTATLYWCISGQAPDDTYICEDRTSPITITGLKLEAGVKYYLNFVIGLHTLSLDVTAQDWTGNTKNVDIQIEHGTSAHSSLARQTNH